MIQTSIKAQEEKNIAPDDVGAGAASIVFGGEDGVAIRRLGTHTAALVADALVVAPVAQVVLTTL